MSNKKKKRERSQKPPATQSSAMASSAEESVVHTPTRHRWIVSALVASVILTALFLAQRTHTPSDPPPAAPTAIAAPHYAGADVCAGCHDTQHSAWHGSDHDLAMRVADATSVLGDFNDAQFTYAGTTSTFSRRGDKFVANTDGPDGQLHDYEIGYTFGVHPLQQYLIDFPDGRKQALSIAWDSRPKNAGGQRWFHLYPNDNVKAGDWLHWTKLSQNWNFTCAECHSTDLRKNYDPASNTYKTTWAEINVACEACHGPGSDHVVWARKEGGSRLETNKGFAVALDERHDVTWTAVPDTGNATRSTPRLTAFEINTCARCHARAGRLTDDYVHGKSLLDSHRPARLDVGLYWTDGQMRGEVYNWGSFLQSKMYAQGVTCSDCHDPHSLKLRAPGNAVCAQCHQATKYDAPSHTHHTIATPGAACASCHMPTTTYMVVDARHDHSLRIPRPDLSVKLGTPNACTGCHAKQSPQWAADTIAKWTGKPPAGYQHFAEAFQVGAVGAPGARDVLLALINDAGQPALVRASAIDRLANWLTADTIAVVGRTLSDPDPSVRLAAVEALANSAPEVRIAALAPLLGDPVLAVRIEAARALAGASERSLTPPQRAAFDAALADYVAVQTYNSDRPEGHSNLGNLAAARGDTNAAITHYRQAIALDPQFVAAYVNLADVYRAMGNEVDAQVTLHEGIAADPRDAAVHYALGLALTRQNARDPSLVELRKAVQLAPNNGRFAYVYAVALNDAGQHNDAIQVLKTALKANANDRNLLVGLTYFSEQSGDGAAARKYIGELRILDPDDAQFVQLEHQIDRSAH